MFQPKNKNRLAKKQLKNMVPKITKQFQKNGPRTGFTLIEILVVIGLIALLAAVVLIAVNPARQFAQGRNAQRISNVETILNAIGQRIADNKGLFPTSPGCATAMVVDTVYTIAVGSTAPASSIDLSCLVPTYISAQLPVDPSTGIWTNETDYNTDYTVKLDSIGRYEICAINAAEPALPGSAAICISR